MSPEINSYTYGRVIYNKGGKNIQWLRDSLIIGAGKIWQPRVKQKD